MTFITKMTHEKYEVYEKETYMKGELNDVYIKTLNDVLEKI